MKNDIEVRESASFHTVMRCDSDNCQSPHCGPLYAMGPKWAMANCSPEDWGLLTNVYIEGNGDRDSGKRVLGLLC